MTTGNPFSRYRVYEFGGSWAGGLCGSYLGALGMAVTAYRDPTAEGISPDVVGWDWSKTVTAEEPAAELLNQADVVLDVGTRRLEAIGSGTVFCNITGDTHDAHDLVPEVIAQARTGMLGYVGRRDRPPIRIGTPVVTFATAMAAFQAILAGLYRREMSGTGTQVVVSMVRTAMALIGNNVTSESDPDARVGFAVQADLPSDRGFECSDGTVDFVFNRDDEGFQRFCTWLGAAWVGEDSRFATLNARLDHPDALADELEPLLAHHSVDEVLGQLQLQGALHAKRYSVSELHEHPQINHLDLLHEVDSRTLVAVPFLLNRIRPRPEPLKELS